MGPRLGLGREKHVSPRLKNFLGKTLANGVEVGSDGCLGCGDPHRNAAGATQGYSLIVPTPCRQNLVIGALGLAAQAF